MLVLRSLVERAGVWTPDEESSEDSESDSEEEGETRAFRPSAGCTEDSWGPAASPADFPPSFLFLFGPLGILAGSGTLLASTSGPVGSINPGVTPLLELPSIAPG